ncbi:uncharacterized protein [Anabrus simplex]|uniref:uncharacterized protein n=1 Tax=Anabrus simplex TaxID=316456 RepID=UPI0035A37E3C
MTLFMFFFLSTLFSLAHVHLCHLELPRGCLVQHIDVRAGSSYQDRGGLVRRVTRTVLFTSRLLADKIPPHDIAVIKVDEPWPLDGNTISLARLPRQDDPIPVRERATIMGWGTTDREETEPETLMKQEVVVISHELCNVSWWFRPYTKPVITEKHICTLLHPEESPSFTFKVNLIYTWKIQNESKDVLACGGTIITKDWLLTAAQCADLGLPKGVSVEQIKALAGSTYLDRGGEMREISETVSHDYPPHDIALMKLGCPMVTDLGRDWSRLPPKLHADHQGSGWLETVMANIMSNSITFDEYLVY